ncbi:peptidase M48 [Aphanothece hegewaldii CCALA 016]|uniref:Peptidase M48 n=1 Tax=Aphanothece hegewaldii CCALA 016 TaxID=2107694 RepID=A0A2T1M1M3_9CHRO|nr:M48 family metalloprotease [Aphanothece hegewaldii]PSF38607.1 peptidase M48 [Aphanothece hegewaldii CCALA 016]
MSLEEGLKALQKQDYTEAIAQLEAYCQQSANVESPFYIQGKMALARAYRASNQKEQAIKIAQELEQYGDRETRTWAKSFLLIINAEERKYGVTSSHPIAQLQTISGRAGQIGVKLAMRGIGGNLALASGVTIFLLFGMMLVSCLALLFIVNNQDPVMGLGIAVVLTLIFNTLVFFVSPWIMDLTQHWLYKTRWVTIAEIKRHSPESAYIIQQICQEKKINQPRLGIIDDQNPTAFTYGSLPNQARLVVSQGIFTYLADDEAATVYAHELGHIVHWDFAIMTSAATLVQITYLIFVFVRQIGRKDDKLGNAASLVGFGAYIFYIIGTYLTLYLSRTREYFADHFAAEATGNPNGLSRALVKIAYGILEQQQNSHQPSSLLEGTRALGIYDAKAAVSIGTAYRITSDPSQIGRVFLWDLYNPWGWFTELNSTHPLTGKRVRALSTYAEQMDLPTEFNMANVIQEGNQLEYSKLYGNFIIDVLLLNAQLIGIFLGLLLSAILFKSTSSHAIVFLALPIIGFGIGTLIKLAVMYPSMARATNTDIFTLMSDPYASPLRGRPVKLKGQILGRGDAGYQFGSDLMLQDATGIIFTRYSSRLGGLGNFLFGWRKVQKLIGEDVRIMGWFRRSITPSLDWIQMSHRTTTIKSYHRFWEMVMGIIAIAIGGFLLFSVSQA